jgi:pimeloyl-ACP methyl ester carboxylesterase
MKKPLLCFITACFALLCYTGVSAAPKDALYTHPGRLVAASPHRLNLYCIGSGSTTVVFDSGWEDWAPAWALVQPAVAKWTRACTYDRAGSGFSDPGPMPRTSVRIADELHSALHNAGIPGPYVLVGHSFGSYNTRVFADRYMPEIAGLVLVDGENGDVEPASARRTDDREYAAITKELRSCRDALVAGRPLPLLPVRRGAPKMSCNQQFFRGIPERKFSAKLNATVLQITLEKPALYDAVVSEMDEMPWDETYLQRHRRSLGARPVRVLTAQNHYYDTSKTPPALHRKHLAGERDEARNQAKWLTLSSNAKQIFAYKSGHYIELDQPHIVIDAIEDVLRESASASRTPASHT